MRTIFFLIIVLMLDVHTAEAQFTKAELQGAGFTCSMCSKAVYMQLRTLDFVDSIGIGLNDATFVLYFNQNKAPDFNLIKKKVEDAGFSVASFKVFYRFNGLSIASHPDFNSENITIAFFNTTAAILNGEVPLKIIDKGFVSNREYKKYTNRLSGLPQGNNIYHAIPLLP